MKHTLLNTPADRWALVTSYLNATGELRPEDIKICQPLFNQQEDKPFGGSTPDYKTVQAAIDHYRKCDADYRDEDRRKYNLRTAIGTEALLRAFGYDMLGGIETDEMGNPLHEPDLRSPCKDLLNLNYPVVCISWLEADFDTRGTASVVGVTYVSHAEFPREPQGPLAATWAKTS